MTRIKHTASFLKVLHAILLLTAFSACVKEVDQFIPFDQSVGIDLKAAFGDPDDTLEYSIAGSSLHSFYSKGGSFLTFGPEIFEFADGSPCTCSSVQIRVIEQFKKKDLVIYQTSTVYSNRLLTNFKTFFISADSEGRPLYLRPNKYFTLITPSQDPDETMQLFLQDPGQASIGWTKAGTTSGSISNISSGEWETDKDPIPGYRSKVDQLGWISISRIESEEMSNQVLLTLEKDYGQKNTVIFSISKNSESVQQFSESEPGVFNTSISPGSEVLLLGISRKAVDSYELAVENTVIGVDHVQPLSFQSKSLEEIRSLLDSL